MSLEERIEKAISLLKIMKDRTYGLSERVDEIIFILKPGEPDGENK